MMTRLLVSGVIAACLTSPGYASDFGATTTYALQRLEMAFFAGDTVEVQYALRSVVVSCLSQQVTSPPMRAPGPPCDMVLQALGSGCGGDTDGAQAFRCAGTLIARAMALERGSTFDPAEQLRAVLASLRSPTLLAGLR
jgi:hypothetical protein